MITEKVKQIIAEHGDVLCERSALGTIRDLRSLPYSKEAIKSALKIALSAVADPAMREQLKVGYLLLADFQPLSDREVVALQLWQQSLAGNGPQPREEGFDLVVAASSLSVDIQQRVANESEVLSQELKAAGLWGEPRR